MTNITSSLDSDPIECERVIPVNPVQHKPAPEFDVSIPTGSSVEAQKVERNVALATVIHPPPRMQFLLTKITNEVGGMVEGGMERQHQRMAFVPLTPRYARRQHSTFHVQRKVTVIAAATVCYRVVEIVCAATAKVQFAGFFSWRGSSQD